MKNSLSTIKTKTIYSFCALLLLLPFFTPHANAVDMTKLEQDLKTTGIDGWIHGAVESQGLYVFTYRNPTDFFDYVEMSLVTDDADITKTLATLKRNDKVHVTGKFLKNPSPQKHIWLKSIALVKKYESGYPSDPYQHEAKLPDDLLTKTTATFLVHAIGGDGHILVVEYKDSIVPIFVKNADLTKNLFRNDLVKLNFKIQTNPDAPVHLNLDDSVAQPVTVLESIQALHGKPASVEGALIMFPKSPEIIFNVFAVQQLLPEGLNRQYTIVNFDNPDVFTQVRKALQAAWDRHPNDYTNARNKLLNTKIKVKITGTFNEVDPNQANAQILVKSVDDVKIEE